MTISHSIRSLEGEPGIELFQKKGKYIALTDKGRKLMNKFAELVIGFQNLRGELIDEADDKFYYKLAATHILASKILIPAWAKVDLLSLRPAQVVEGILNKELDVGLYFSPQFHPDLEINTLHKGQMYFVVRKNHPVRN